MFRLFGTWFALCLALWAASQCLAARGQVPQLDLLLLSEGNRLDPATTAWVNAVVTAGGTVSPTQKGYVDTLIRCYKTKGIFSIWDREWLLWSENVQQAETDLINLSAWTNHSVTFTANAGMVGNGTSQYIDSGYNPSTAGGNFVAASGALDVYVTVRTSSNSYAVGAADGTTNTYIRIGSNPDFQPLLNNIGADQSSGVTDTGLDLGTITSASAGAAYQDGTSVGTFTGTGTANVNDNLFIFALNLSGSPSTYSANTFAMVGAGGGLTSALASAKATCDNGYAKSKGFNTF